MSIILLIWHLRNYMEIVLFVNFIFSLDLTGFFFPPLLELSLQCSFKNYFTTILKVFLFYKVLLVQIRAYNTVYIIQYLPECVFLCQRLWFIIMDVMHADLERKLLAVFLLLASIIIVKCVSIEIAKTFNGIGLILTFFHNVVLTVVLKIVISFNREKITWPR